MLDKGKMYALVVDINSEKLKTYYIEQFIGEEYLERAFVRIAKEAKLNYEKLPEMKELLNADSLPAEIYGITPVVKGFFEPSDISVLLVCLSDMLEGKKVCELCQYYFDYGGGECVTPYVDNLILPGDFRKDKVISKGKRDRYLLGLEHGVCPFMAYKLHDFRPKLDGVSDYNSYLSSLMEKVAKCQE